MKKIFISTIAFIIIFLTSSITSVYATDKSGKSTADDGSWVSKAFSAASTFMNEPTKDFKGILSPTLHYSNIVKAINRILIVLLAGIQQ